MSRRRDRSAGPHGLLRVDKPAGPTSFTVMRAAERQLGAGRAGHAGTLDPAADGLLVVLLGEATKLSAWVMGWDKTYVARVRFGVLTDTLDAEGAIVEQAVVPEGALTRARIEAALPAFLGEVDQRAPVYAAIKVDGRSLMSRARGGEVVEAPVRRVRCDGIELLAIEGDEADLRMHVGSGYYVRSFARDLGAALGLPASLCALRRERVGPWHVDDAVAPDQATAADVVPIIDSLPGIPVVHLDAKAADAARHGRPVEVESVIEGERALLVGPDGDPLAMASPGTAGRWRVQRGLRLSSESGDGLSH